MAQIDEAPRTLSKDEIIALALRIGKFYAYVVSDMGRLGPRRKARGLRIHARRAKAAKRRVA